MPRLQPEPLPSVSRLSSLFETREILRDPVRVFARHTARLGDTFVYYFGGIKKVIVSSNSDVLRHVLKTNYENYHKSEIQMERMRHFLGQGLLNTHGEKWRTQRRLIQQGFHRDQLAALATTMHESLLESLESFDKAVRRGPIDIYPELTKITFRMVGRSLFSTAVAADDIALVGSTILRIQEFIVRQIGQPYLRPWFALSGELRKHEDLRARADQVVMRQIRARREGGAEHSDLLQILLDARYDDGQGMSDELVLSESIQLLAAGHETSSSALSWTLYLLSRHRDCIDELRHEFDAVLGDAPVQYADVAKLTFATQVLEESLRLYPPFWMVDRVSLADDRAADIAIPKGTTVIAFIHGAHHSSQYWDRPESFMPERFTSEGKHDRKAFTHLPFGGGPRGCIGGNYAMLQMLIILSVLVRRYEFELVPGQTISGRPMIILRPNGGIRMTFRNVTKLHAAAPAS